MSNAVIRLFQSGMRDADERVAKALQPRTSIAVDRYLASSLTVRVVDRFLQRWASLWPASTAYAIASTVGFFHDADWIRRYEALGSTLVIAAMTYVALSMSQGPRRGWFWMVIPALAFGFGILLLAASRSASRS
jgi:hypothetical protein